MSIPSRGRFGFGGYTAAAATVINVLIPPRSTKLFSIITTIRYSNGGTTQGHTITFLKPVGSTTVTSATTAGQKVVPLVADPTAALVGPNGTTSQVAASATSANDWLVFQLPDGTYYFDKANSTVTTTVTMTSNLPTNGLAAGAKVWNMKIASFKDPWTGNAFESVSGAFETALSSTLPNVIQDVDNGLTSSNRAGEPILVQSNNISVAGTIDWIAGIYATAA
jgi:hypothetical protein